MRRVRVCCGRKGRRGEEGGACLMRKRGAEEGKKGGRLEKASQPARSQRLAMHCRPLIGCPLLESAISLAGELSGLVSSHLIIDLHCISFICVCSPTCRDYFFAFASLHFPFFPSFSIKEPK